MTYFSGSYVLNTDRIRDSSSTDNGVMKILVRLNEDSPVWEYARVNILNEYGTPLASHAMTPNGVLDTLRPGAYIIQAGSQDPHNRKMIDPITQFEFDIEVEAGMSASIVVFLPSGGIR